MPKNLAWTQQQVDSMLPSPAKFRQKINNYDIHKTQSLLQIIILNLKNINKYLAPPRYWRRQNIRVDKIICVFKIIGVDKILASKKYTRQQNLGVNEKLVQTESWRRRRRISLL